MGVHIPKGTLKRLTLGQSFAEYDRVLEKAGVFMETPPLRAAVDTARSKCFFVGRRGTGKTAISLYLERTFPKKTLLLLPQLLTPIEKFFSVEEMLDVHQRPFKSLVCSFKRAILDEVMLGWIRNGLFSFRTNSLHCFTRERNFIEDFDFDTRLLRLAGETLDALINNLDKDWLRAINRAKELGNAMDGMREKSRWDFVVLIDRIDESWDGSDKAVALLMALMHACVELTASTECVRPLLFLRENVFDRVRLVDKEFSRLETFVISLEWTREQLVEFVERRLNASLIAKLPLRGPTWDAFFEETAGQSSQEIVFSQCQYRPRDVLTYCSFAIESAQARLQERILVEDLQTAKRRFSLSRLKDLCDEYADNFPQLQLVLSRFYGLGCEYTVQGIDAFIKKLLVDEEVKSYCGKWIFRFTQPDLFISLLYDLGFFGINDGGSVHFRSQGPQTHVTPRIGAKDTVVIHPSYGGALNLQQSIVSSLESVSLRQEGLISDLPGSIDIAGYQQELQALRDELKTLPEGEEHCQQFEDLLGELIRLCFFRVLSNVEKRVRSLDGRVVRDWIASNHASDGFWEMVRQRYAATQVIWECKNYSKLGSADFHQVSYYMNEAIGRFALIAFRGQEKKRHYYDHVRRIANDKRGVILILSGKDLDVFVRQAMNGKNSEGHLREIYDTTVREIS